MLNDVGFILFKFRADGQTTVISKSNAVQGIDISKEKTPANADKSVEWVLFKFLKDGSANVLTKSSDAKKPSKFKIEIEQLKDVKAPLDLLGTLATATPVEFTKLDFAQFTDTKSESAEPAKPEGKEEDEDEKEEEEGEERARALRDRLSLPFGSYKPHCRSFCDYRQDNKEHNEIFLYDACLDFCRSCKEASIDEKITSDEYVRRFTACYCTKRCNKTPARNCFNKCSRKLDNYPDSVFFEEIAQPLPPAPPPLPPRPTALPYSIYLLPPLAGEEPGATILSFIPAQPNYQSNYQQKVNFMPLFNTPLETYGLLQYSDPLPGAAVGTIQFVPVDPTTPGAVRLIATPPGLPAGTYQFVGQHSILAQFMNINPNQYPATLPVQPAIAPVLPPQQGPRPPQAYPGSNQAPYPTPSNWPQNRP